MKQEIRIDAHMDIIRSNISNIYLHFPREFSVAFLRLGSVNNSGGFYPPDLHDKLEEARKVYGNMKVKVSQTASLLLKNAKTPIDSPDKL